MEFNYLKMVLNTLEIGIMINLMVKDVLFYVMGVYIKVTGKIN